jgi:saccharopine dehydrogenase-like NADP-dependent oxidoreductase
LPTTGEDVVLVFITASGLQAGKLRQETYVNRVLHGEVGGRPMAAIQLTTAAAVCVMVDLLAQGQLPRAGLLRQEDVALEQFVSNRFGRHYQASDASSVSS